MSQDILKTVSQLRDSLIDYIEATYHIRDEPLIRQRKQLLESEGVIHQIPYLESTPKYETGRSFDSIRELHQDLLPLLENLSDPSSNARVFFNPPYRHQENALIQFLEKGKNLIITTGTGSGKTESFLLPTIGKIAKECIDEPESFNGCHAVRGLLLYPMNALVNDQLGRIRALFGSKVVKDAFRSRGCRIPTFCRYTSRTPYAGARTPEKDGSTLKPLNDFYIEIEDASRDTSHPNHDASKILKGELEKRGKWPQKPDLRLWFGETGTRWNKRAHTLSDDSELITRHEAQTNPPDLLITNYSMLSYMLMRPIEKPIFDKTKEWLANNPNQKFLVILDEAHLYRGAPGAEVSLLLRRLRDRLGIDKNRFQVICATASFNDVENKAAQFAADLSGTSKDSFELITGDLQKRPGERVATDEEASILAEIDLAAFFKSTSEIEKQSVLSNFFKYRDFSAERISSSGEALFQVLKEFGPMSYLVNRTMERAIPLHELASLIFPNSTSSIAVEALTALLTIGCHAQDTRTNTTLLPARIHNFFRGLPGLWVCMNKDCTEIDDNLRNNICGKMYSQPRVRCGCGSLVLELFTCKNCGSPYGRGYTDDLFNPGIVWPISGIAFDDKEGTKESLKPIDLLLAPNEDVSRQEIVNLVEFDLKTGRIGSEADTTQTRLTAVKTQPTEVDSRISDDDRGKFIPCCVCGQYQGSQVGQQRSSYVQDHQTKGDEPFSALVTKQIQIQPESHFNQTDFSPLSGRKSLLFSDSRQVAAKLAPQLQKYSNRDVIRPLILWGFKRLQRVDSIRAKLSLKDLYFAIVIATKPLRVRLRPELYNDEFFSIPRDIHDAFDTVANDYEDSDLKELRVEFDEKMPDTLIEHCLDALFDKFTGFEALALASIKETEKHTGSLLELPNIPGEIETPEDKLRLARFWLRCWNTGGKRNNVHMTHMQTNIWFHRTDPQYIVGSKSPLHFQSRIEGLLLTKKGFQFFKKYWVPRLTELFTQPTNSDDGAGKAFLKANSLTLDFDNGWFRCSRCTMIQRPAAENSTCMSNGCDGKTHPFLPESDIVFQTRKGFYRNPAIAAIEPPFLQPTAIIAAEHTAQLNAPQSENIFSQAEKNELLFQDVKIDWKSEGNSSAIDILSSTTTMEVGIDIGSLSAVALRNMPPGRANYQQRAGRAGRRGNSIATVVAFGSTDSHDENFFSKPDDMIRGPVTDPSLTLDNKDIIRRHIRSYLLQNYHQDRISDDSIASNPNLFSVLGTVDEFITDGELNRRDFESWLTEHQAPLRERIKGWLPDSLTPEDISDLLETMVSDTLDEIDVSIPETISVEIDSESDSIDGDFSNDNVKNDTNSLLGRLMFTGTLPRYGFPTDVVSFSIFSEHNQDNLFIPKLEFNPSQSAHVALSQYAPGKNVVVSGKTYTSGALYSVSEDARFTAWRQKKKYAICEKCGHATRNTQNDDDSLTAGNTKCVACEERTMGKPRTWITPPGFAHPYRTPEQRRGLNDVEISYATRAKLMVPSPEENKFLDITTQIKAYRTREHLVVSNLGPENEGYNYCVSCGRIEAAVTQEQFSSLKLGHDKPFPDKKQQCEAPTKIARNIYLGTEFITDLVLFSLRLEKPLSLPPKETITKIALRTLCEALSRAGAELLDIEPRELVAEYRSKLNADGRRGKEVEVYIYDTLSGGAGFSHQLYNLGEELFQKALEIVKNCPERCDSSCYRCLRSFSNKLEHSQIDREVGVSLLEFLLTGKRPEFSEVRLNQSAQILFEDLTRFSTTNHEFFLNSTLPNDSNKECAAPILAHNLTTDEYTVIDISPPMMFEFPSPQVEQLLKKNLYMELPIYVSETLIRNNLPAATLMVRKKLDEV